MFKLKLKLRVIDVGPKKTKAVFFRDLQLGDEIELSMHFNTYNSKYITALNITTGNKETTSLTTTNYLVREDSEYFVFKEIE